MPSRLPPPAPPTTAVPVTTCETMRITDEWAGRNGRRQAPVLAIVPPRLKGDACITRSRSEVCWSLYVPLIDEQELTAASRLSLRRRRSVVSAMAAVAAACTDASSSMTSARSASAADSLLLSMPP